jgi:hypothetical protein
VSARLEDLFSIDRFESTQIDPSQFDHQAHVYVGWLYIQAYPRKQAIARFDGALQRFAERIGAESKYNAMITWLFLMLIAERFRADEDWPAFRSRNADLFEQGPWAPAT